MMQQASLTELNIDLLLSDSSSKDDFLFFQEVIGSNDPHKTTSSSLGLSLSEQHVVSSPKNLRTLSSSSPSSFNSSTDDHELSPVWNWNDNSDHHGFEDDSFLELLDSSDNYQDSDEFVSPVGGVMARSEAHLSNSKLAKQRAPKKRMLEISAAASLKAENDAKSKEQAYQAKREQMKRHRIRRKNPKKRRIVVEQKLVELVRVVKMYQRTRKDLFDSSTGLISIVPSKSGAVVPPRGRAVGLAIEAFLNSYMFVQPSEHEYIFQLVNPISESCTLSIPSLASLVAEAKSVLPFVNISSADQLYNSLPSVVAAKYYGFSEILKSSEIFGNVIRFLFNNSPDLVPLNRTDPDAPLPSFSTSLDHAQSCVSFNGNKFTTPFLWQSIGLSRNVQLRGMVSCTIANDLVVSITIHFDPLVILKQAIPLACETLLKVNVDLSYFTGGSYGL